MALFETMADVNFCTFMLGTFGIAFFMLVHKLLCKCNPKVFSAVCVVLAYFYITNIA